MGTRVDVKPELLRWAITRSGKTPDDYASRFPRLAEWMRAKTKPTLRPRA